MTVKNKTLNVGGLYTKVAKFPNSSLRKILPRQISVVGETFARG